MREGIVKSMGDVDLKCISLRGVGVGVGVGTGIIG